MKQIDKETTCLSHLFLKRPKDEQKTEWEMDFLLARGKTER